MFFKDICASFLLGQSSGLSCPNGGSVDVCDLNPICVIEENAECLDPTTFSAPPAMVASLAHNLASGGAPVHAIDGTVEEIGQTFTITTAGDADYAITLGEFRMDRVGSPTGIIVGEIRSGADLTTVITSVEANQDISTLGTNASVHFNFPPVRLQSGVEYAMYVYVLGGVQDASNRLLMRQQVSGGYPDGQYLIGSDAGARTGSWSAYDTSFRLLGGTYP